MDNGKANGIAAVRAPDAGSGSSELSWLVNGQNEAPPTGVKISVIGGGFVGLVTAAGLAQTGHTVTCIEKDSRKVAELASGRVAMYERGLAELVQANLKRDRLSFEEGIGDSVAESDVIVITVGTPSNAQGQADLRALTEVLKALAGRLRGNQIVTIKSTVPIGTARWAEEMLRNGNGASKSVAVISNPEFLREGTAVYDFFHPRRIVVGGSSPEAVDKVVQVYRAGLARPAPIVVTTNETAEMIKYASNVYLATRVAFINELSAVCDAHEIEVAEVSSAMGLDPRIGAEYLDVGPGFGGSCLPKDLEAFVSGAQNLGVDLAIAPAVRLANERQFDRVAGKITEMAGGALKGKRIGVLGLAFKAHTQDMRDSPSMKIILRLLAEGAAVRAYDPAAMAEAEALLPDVDLCTAAADVAIDADVIVVLTEWPEFQTLNWTAIHETMRTPNLVDARNLLMPESMARYGFKYIGMGQK